MKLLMVSLGWDGRLRTVFVRLQSDGPVLSERDWRAIVALMGYPSALPEHVTVWQ